MERVLIGCSGWNYKDWAREREVFVYYNNDWNAFAINNGRFLTSLVSK